MTVAVLLIFCVNVQATPFWFDVDGLGTDYAPVLVTEFNGEAIGQYSVDIDLGGDGVLGNTDNFTENVIVGISDAANTALTPSIQQQYPVEDSGTFYPSLWGQMTLTGSIYDFSQTGADTSYGDINMIDDQFKLNFDAGGSVQFMYDKDYSDTTGPDLVGDFAVVLGMSEAFHATGNDTLTAQMGILLMALSLAPDTFFFDNAGVMGNDMAPGLGTTNLLFGLSDGSVNLVAAADGLASNHIDVTVEDNGIDIEIYPIVPEPATLLLFGFGLLGLLGYRRKK